MERKDAARLILLESADYPELMEQVRLVYEEYAAGQRVQWQALAALLEEAGGKGVIAAFKEKNPETLNDVIVTLGREIDRDAPVVRDRPRPETIDAARSELN